MRKPIDAGERVHHRDDRHGRVIHRSDADRNFSRRRDTGGIGGREGELVGAVGILARGVREIRKSSGQHALGRLGSKGESQRPGASHRTR